MNTGRVIDDEILVGLSMGGAIAQAFYRAFPDKVRSLVLAATFSYFPEPVKQASLENRLAYIDQGKMEELAEIIATRSFTENAPVQVIQDMKKVITANDPDTYRASMIASVNADSRDILAKISVPVLPEARHVLTHEKPEQFNQVLLQFLHQVENRSFM